MTFPLVAIGASAGGLEPISELLHALPPGSGMAYAVVQHLNPDYESMLSEILTKKTPVPVMQVKEDTEIQPDRIYLIAPNTSLTVVDNMFRVTARESGVHLPVDLLFASIAEDRGELAIGVVLSGGGGDGSLGLQAIKQAGGITFAQEPTSARFPSMPQTAIDTGCVDFVLCPQEIARELMRLAQHPYLRAVEAAGPPEDAEKAPQAADEAALRRVFRRLRNLHGVDFTHYKRSTLRRRLDRRMVFHRVDKIADYAVLLEGNEAETAALYQDFLIRVTGFFRDPQSFETLVQRVFPSVCDQRSPKAPLRIWVPGCASGEEVYSIAIALMEYLGDRPAPAGIQIFGTDVSDTALEKSRAGVYLDTISQEVSSERLGRFFVKQTGGYRIAKSIRDLCIFARHDITRDPPFSRLDLVSCRNLLIYLDATVQHRVMGNFYYALRPNGFLLLGPSETVGLASSLFEITDKQSRLYTLNPTPPAADSYLRASSSARFVRRADLLNTEDPVVHESDLAQREADRILLARFAPASVLIDDALNILQFRGETGPYLEHASGPSSLNLQRVVRPELLIEISPAIQKARETGVEVRCETLRLDEMAEVSMVVVPLRRASPEQCFLILFEGARGSAVRRAQQGANSLPESEKDRRLAQLEQETASLRDYLQTIIEENEASKEELKSAHEEVLSSNEEFQSTNEELETAKEELQSANEELTTTNEELRQRNRELGILNISVEQARKSAESARAEADIIVESVREPLIVLDDKLHIVRANRAYYSEFDTRAETTLGRLFNQVDEGTWDIPALRLGLHDVIARNESIEDFEISQVFPRIGRRSVRLNARKMQGSGTQSDLILLAIADVTARTERAEQLAQEVKRKDEFLATLAHELRNPLAPIASAVQLLRLGDSKSSTSDLHDMIERQTKRLVRLVDELLDIARINQGLIELKREPLDLAKLLEQTAASARLQLSSRQQELSVTLFQTPMHVFGDSVRLEQIITNLLDNASKYTPLGGRISLTLGQSGREAILSVRDTGIGLAPDSLETIFDLFSQVNAAPGNIGGGLGIGLALVRRVLELHGGRIEARSGGLGQGSEFIVHLPLLLDGASQGIDPSSTQASVPAAGIAPRRVLIVDDNEDAGESLAMLMRAWGHEAIFATDGPSAISLAENFKPQILLLDIGLPGMNGYQVARHFRTLPQYANVNLIAVTGFGREEDRLAALAAGFDRHLVKPLTADQIAALFADGSVKGH